MLDKVYIVIGTYEYDTGAEVLGVFTSKEKAEQFKEDYEEEEFIDLDNYCDYVFIEEKEIG